MKIENLMTVLTVARLKNFSQAAFELYCSQSSVSRSIMAVESELNTTLFQRSSNSNVVQLTRQGELLLPQIRALLDSYRELEKMAKVRDENCEALFRLGVGTDSFSADMKSTMASQLYLSYPEIVLHIEDVNNSQFLEYLTLDKLDAILFYQPYWKDGPMEPPHFPENVMCIPIARVNLKIGVGRKHPLAAHKAITARMLANEKFIFDDDSVNMADNLPLNQHGMFMRMCRENGFTPEIIRIGRDLVNVKLFITAQNEYVFPSFMPSSVCRYQGIGHVLVSDAPYYAQYYLLAASGGGGKVAVEKLAAFLQQTFHSGYRE